MPRDLLEQFKDNPVSVSVRPIITSLAGTDVQRFEGLSDAVAFMKANKHRDVTYHAVVYVEHEPREITETELGRLLS